jgi:hypothetical protein
LFINMRSAASCGHPLQESAVPRGAVMRRVAWIMVVQVRRVAAKVKR